MRRIILFSNILILLLLSEVYSQDSSLKDLPQPDWNFKLFQEFYKTDEYVFVITDVNDTETYKDIWTKCKSIGRDPSVTVTVKNENQLNEEDYRKHMFLCGPINRFKKWDSFGLPIKKVQGGFRFGSYTFDDVDDGILFISSDSRRVVYTGNSLSPLDKLLRTLGGLFQYTIVQNDVPAHFGNFINGRFNVRGNIDLKKERRKYLNRNLTSGYHVFHYSGKVSDFKELKEKAAHLEKYCDEAIEKLSLARPDYKIHCYIYSDENEKLLLSGTPGRGGVTYGQEIHSLGFDAVEHETIHVLFNSEVGQPNNNFFNEGVRQYYEYVSNPESLAEGRKVVAKYLNEPIEKWADGSIYFFNTPAVNRWPVAYPASGLFVKFLIDNHGLERFKEFYRKTDINSGFLDVYGKSLADMVKEWKDTEATTAF